MHNVLPAIGRASSDALSVWAQAYADMVAAERAGDDPAATMQLTDEVLRARCALTRQRITDGWFPGLETVLRLRLDEYLLRLGGT